MRKNIIYALYISLAAIIITGVANVALASWTTPSTTPPGGNVYAPINVGSVSQVKSGGIEMGSLLVDNSASVTGSLGVGTASPGYKLQVAGTIGATGFFYTSDERLKTDIVPLSDTAALANIEQLQGVSFTWKAGTPSAGQQSVGLIAQDVAKVYPQLVATDPNTGLESVEYGNLVAPLIEAVKAQQAEITELQAEVAGLKGSN